MKNRPTSIGVRWPSIICCLLFLAAGCAKKEYAPPAPAPPDYPSFPWPPPQASASAIIPREAVEQPGVDTMLLGQVDRKLRKALDDCGYVETSYFWVPGGFAAATRLEQINPDGTSKNPPDRWAATLGPLREFSLTEYLKALFTARTGLYRIIVFVVTPHPFSQSNEAVSRDEAMAWLREGLIALPGPIADQPFTDDHVIAALIYEFEQPGSQEATLHLPGRLTGREHLRKSGFLSSLEE